MIYQQVQPLPAPQVEKIRRWLNDPAAIEFQRVVAALAAQASVNIVAKSIEDVDGEEKQEILDNVQVARQMNGVLKVMDEMRKDDYKFEIVHLYPQMQTQPEPKP